MAAAERPASSLDIGEAAPLCDDVAVIGVEPDHQVIRHVQATASARTVPLNVTLELTLNCNIRCLHCYNLDRDEPSGSCHDGRLAAVEQPRPNLSLEEILRLLPELRAAGCLILGLTGGEVLTYPHLFAVLDRARDLNMAVQLLTNGTMLRPGIAGRLAKYRNLLGVSVSLYGSTAEVHDGITQIRGSFKRTWDGVHRMRAAGVAARLKFIVMRPNAHQVAEMRAQAAALGYPFVVDVTITSRHDGTNGSLAMRVTDEQLAEIYRGPLRDMLPKRVKPVTDDGFRCNCARGNCAITVTGDVQPCISVPWSAGNVRDRPFIDIWRYSPVFQKIRGLRVADYPECAPCPDKDYCPGNRGAAFTHSGSYTGTDPFVCRSAAVTREILTSGSPPPAPSATDAPLG